MLEAALRPQGQALAKLFSYEYDAAGNRPLEQIEMLGGSPALNVTDSDFKNTKQPAEGRYPGMRERAGSFRGSFNVSWTVRLSWLPDRDACALNR